MDVGLHEFGTLDRVEIGLAVLGLALAALARPARAIWIGLCIAALIVANQALWLLPLLDAAPSSSSRAGRRRQRPGTCSTSSRKS